MAKLYFRYGAMNSGKTALLLQAAHNYEEQGMKVLIAKPSADTKGDCNIVSRIGLERKVDFLVTPEDDVFQMVQDKRADIKCLFIDEAQFLQSHQVDQLMQIVILLNIPVICYGLRCDFKGNGFSGSTRLLETAHTIEEMKTICKCGKKAMYNGRKVNGEFTFDGDQIAIDGKDEVTYEALCPHCYYEELAAYNKMRK